MKSRMVRKGIVAAKKTKKKVFNFVSKNEIDKRLKKAKQSKREFTWFG